MNWKPIKFANNNFSYSTLNLLKKYGGMFCWGNYQHTNVRFLNKHGWTYCRRKTNSTFCKHRFPGNTLTHSTNEDLLNIKRKCNPEVCINFFIKCENFKPWNKIVGSSFKRKKSQVRQVDSWVCIYIGTIHLSEIDLIGRRLVKITSHLPNRFLIEVWDMVPLYRLRVHLSYLWFFPYKGTTNNFLLWFEVFMLNEKKIESV
jgi:hypothetical protein